MCGLHENHYVALNYWVYSCRFVGINCFLCLYLQIYQMKILRRFNLETLFQEKNRVRFESFVTYLYTLFPNQYFSRLSYCHRLSFLRQWHAACHIQESRGTKCIERKKNDHTNTIFQRQHLPKDVEKKMSYIYLVLLTRHTQ